MRASAELVEFGACVCRERAAAWRSGEMRFAVVMLVSGCQRRSEYLPRVAIWNCTDKQMRSFAGNRHIPRAFSHTCYTSSDINNE